jgi:hypothetical protein
MQGLPQSRAAGPDSGPWFMDIGLLAADGNRDRDWYLYSGYDAAGTYAYGSFQTSAIGTPTRYNSRWWWRDFGPGGIWDVKVIHTTGFDVGIYSFRIDEVEFARLDGYSLNDANSVETVVATGLLIPPGRHKFSFDMVAINGSYTGTPFYAAAQGVLFRRTGSLTDTQRARGALPRGSAAVLGGPTITILPMFSTGNTNWNALAGTAAAPNSCEFYSTGAVNAARWWDLDLVAGPWTLDLMCQTYSAGGIISVQVDGVTQATIDTYSAATAYGVRKTATINVPTSGTHRLTLLMATKHASASAYGGDISNMQLRHAAPGIVRNYLAPRIVDTTAFWSSGNTNWATLVHDASQLFDAEMQSTGDQNAEIWWYLELAAGTWDIELLHLKTVNCGIYSVRVDGAEIGTFDGYGATSRNNKATITGFRVGATGRHKLSLVMATKNASASSYVGAVTAFQLRRTA